MLCNVAADVTLNVILPPRLRPQWHEEKLPLELKANPPAHQVRPPDPRFAVVLSGQQRTSFLIWTLDNSLFEFSNCLRRWPDVNCLALAHSSSKKRGKICWYLMDRQWLSSVPTVYLRRRRWHHLIAKLPGCFVASLLSGTLAINRWCPALALMPIDTSETLQMGRLSPNLVDCRRHKQFWLDYKERTDSQQRLNPNQDKYPMSFFQRSQHLFVEFNETQFIPVFSFFGVYWFRLRKSGLSIQGYTSNMICFYHSSRITKITNISKRTT